MYDLNKVRETAQKNNFSGVIYIIKNDDVIFEEAYGYADRSNKIENNIDTKFAIASGTKLFTALAIGRLIDAGKLDLSSKAFDILDYKFDEKYYSKDVTIQHLLTHTSGIPDYFDEDLIEDFDNFRVDIPWYDLKEPNDYLSIFPQREMKFSPGEKFSYSNGGFVLLAAIVAKVSGVPYSEFVKQEIFDRCQMYDSGFYSFNQLPSNTANGYIEIGDTWRTNIYNLPIKGGGDGGAYTTAKDLVKLWECLFRYEILSKKLTDTFISPFVNANEENKNTMYGHGIWVQTLDDNKFKVYITGADGGVSFESEYNANTGMSYSVLSNTSEGAWEILDVIYSLKLK